MEEVEEDHEREEDGGPGDVDETSDGGDGYPISLTLHRGEFYYISHLFLFMTSTTDWSVNFRISNGTKGRRPAKKVPNCREFSLLWSNPPLPPGIRENQMISYLSFWQP